MAQEAKESDKTVLVPVADGSEDLEAITIIDVLRRTKKVNLNVGKVGDSKDLNVTLSRGTKVICDDLVENLKETTFDLIALPGGMPGAVKH